MKDKIVQPPINEEFIRAVMRSFYRVEKSIDLADAELDQFMTYMKSVREKLSTKSRVLEIAKSKPLESLIGGL